MNLKLLKIIILTFTPFALFADIDQSNASFIDETLVSDYTPPNSNLMQNVVTVELAKPAETKPAETVETPKEATPQRTLPWAKPDPWTGGLPSKEIPNN